MSGKSKSRFLAWIIVPFSILATIEVQKDEKSTIELTSKVYHTGRFVILARDSIA